jgi:CHAT domain-containing protein
VEYLLSDSGSIAFVVRRDTVAAVDLGAGRRELARLIEFARGTLDPPASRRADSLWRGPLRRLHGHLIAPLEDAGLLAGVSRLVIAPHAELHYLPFAALLGAGDRFLVAGYEVAVTPSAAVWIALADRPAARPGGGVLAFVPKPDVLPASRREAQAIARLAGAAVLTGAAATEAALRRAAPGQRVLHLATYGVLNKHNPLFSFVELAPDGDDDGRLEVHEVFGLDLAADLVVLSACQTALGSGALADEPAGDDWVGLTRAFLHAGARRVVATLWPVEDVATAELMERFYEAYAAGADPVRALARAQRAFAAQAATAQPFYWAGFVAVGAP